MNSFEADLACLQAFQQRCRDAVLERSCALQEGGGLVSALEDEASK